jgi:hypothetical protein
MTMTDTITAPTPCDDCVERTPDDAAWFFCHHRGALAVAKDGNAIMNVVPRFLLVPHALRSTAEALNRSTTDPAGTTINAVNLFAGRLEVVADARLDASDAAAWFMAADPSAVDTIEIAFLDGQQTPHMESQNGWSTDGVAFKVRHDIGVAALDLRGLYLNDGN